VTVLDSTGLVAYLLDVESAPSVRRLIEMEGELAAPDLAVFEVLSALRRMALGGLLQEERAAVAVLALADVPVSLFPSTPLRRRAWELRHNFTVGDAMFAALAERLGEPLATSDGRLARAVAAHPDLDVDVLELPELDA
jgi:predicted nucleic acid-binding protein